MGWRLQYFRRLVGFVVFPLALLTTHCGGGGLAATAAGTTDTATTAGETSEGTGAGEAGDTTQTGGTGYAPSIPITAGDPSFIVKTKIPSPGPQTEIQITATGRDGSTAAANVMILSVLTRKGSASSTTATTSSTATATSVVEVSVQRAFTDTQGLASIKFEGVESGDQTETVAVVDNIRASAVVTDTIEFFLYSVNFADGASNDMGPLTQNQPKALLVYRNKGVVYLMVADTDNARIMIYDLQSSNPRLPVGTLGPKTFQTYTDDDSKCGAAGLFRPTGLAADASRLFVADEGHRRITVFDMDQVIAKIHNPSDTTQLSANKLLGGTSFDATCYPSQPTASATTLWGLQDIVLDTSRNLLFASQAETHRVSVFDVTDIANGEAAVAVIGQGNFTATSAGANLNQLDTPRGLAYDPSTKKLYVADSNNHRVLAFDTATLTSGPTAAKAFGKKATESSWTNCDLLHSPQRVAVDGQGGLLVGTAQILAIFKNIDTGSSYPKIDNVIGAAKCNADWWAATTATASTMGFAAAPYYDATGKNLFVADPSPNRTLRFDVSAGLSDNMAAVDGWGHLNSLGKFDFTVGAINTATGAVNPNASNRPVSSAYDKTHKRLFIADRGNGRVTVYNTRDADGLIAGSKVPGKPWALVDRFADATLGYPSGDYPIPCPSFLSYSDSQDLLYVRDWCSHMIVVYDVASLTQTGLTKQNWVYSIGYNPSTEVFWAVDFDQRLMKKSGGVVVDDDNKILMVNNSAGGSILCYDISGIKTLINDWVSRKVFKPLSPTVVWSTGKQIAQSGWSNADIAFSRGPGRKKLIVSHNYDCSDGSQGCSDVLLFNYPGSCAALGEPTLIRGYRQAGYDPGKLVGSPSGLVTTADDGYLFVSDYGHIRTFDLATLKQVNAIGTDGPEGIGSNPDQFRAVVGLTMTPDDKFLFVMDQDNSRGKIFYRPLCQGKTPVTNNGSYSCSP